MPTFGSLFAGIGGIDLGLERAGWTCRWQVEFDPESKLPAERQFNQRVLARHWPDVQRYGDIKAIDWREVEPVDLIAGGFPCQPFSLAGKRKGKADERWLWPEFARAVRALRPRLVLVENVAGLLAEHGGMGAVLGDLAELGYDAEWDSVPAAAVGAPHLRYRVWIVAHAHGSTVESWRWRWRAPGTGQPLPDLNGLRLKGERSEGLFVAGSSLGDDTPGCGSPLADAHGTRLEGHGGGSHERQGADERTAGPRGVSSPDPDCERWIGRAGQFGPGWWREPSDGSWWSTEPNVGRVAHGVPSRVDRLRALGNAVVPQVVEAIGRRLLEAMNEVAA